MLKINFGMMLNEFKIPAIVLTGIVIYLFLKFLGQDSLALAVVLFSTVLGSYELVKDSLISLLKREYVLDYIAILAIIVSLITGEYLVAAVIALMISSGRTLETYGANNAKKTLTNLVDRIPDEVLLNGENGPGEKIKIKDVKTGQEILVRKGEVIALDAILVSKHGLTDESSLTGEPYEIEKIEGDRIRSGTVNIGDPIIIKVTRTGENSTYNKIIEMVKKAQGEKAPLIRLADKYSVVFTIITFVIAGFAYYYGGSLARVLSVLVVATPCPLILATPIALIGGVNAAAKKRIIVKKLAGLESLSRINSIVFDKTGTITLGVPKVTEFKLLSEGLNIHKILGIAEAIERNSLHPMAKALVLYAKSKNAPVLMASDVKETIGIGIGGVLEGKKYMLSKLPSDEGMAIALSLKGKNLAVFKFEDQIKSESKEIVKKLKSDGYTLYIFTGDKKQAALKVASELGEGVVVEAEMSPEQKLKGVEELKKNGKVVAMVGDGINDAPALALADVGMVFSNEEQTAASEAADVVFLGGDFEHVSNIISISRKTIAIARQSIVWGIGVSTLAMVFAAFGYIPPIAGAALQEAIDVAVIINALRASKS